MKAIDFEKFRTWLQEQRAIDCKIANEARQNGASTVDLMDCIEATAAADTIDFILTAFKEPD